MIAGIEEMLASRFGKDSVVDVLGGTNLEQYSRDCGLGLYVVKAAVEPLLQGGWALFGPQCLGVVVLAGV